MGERTIRRLLIIGAAWWCGKPPCAAPTGPWLALETLGRALPPASDLVFLDGMKALYLDVLALLEPHLRPGWLILADNADYCPDYLAKVRAHDGDSLASLAEDVELSMRLG